jgi:hypothetical protein
VRHRTCASRRGSLDRGMPRSRHRRGRRGQARRGDRSDLRDRHRQGHWDRHRDGRRLGRKRGCRGRRGRRGRRALRRRLREGGRRRGCGTGAGSRRGRRRGRRRVVFSAHRLRSRSRTTTGCLRKACSGLAAAPSARSANVSSGGVWAGGAPAVRRGLRGGDTDCRAFSRAHERGDGGERYVDADHPADHVNGSDDGGRRTRKARTLATALASVVRRTLLCTFVRQCG